MFEASELLGSYVKGIRRLSGAATASLFVPAPLSGLAHPLLIHEGDLPPVPELADLEAAVTFAEKAKSTTIPEGAGPPLIDSRVAGGGLTPLPPIRTFWLGGLLPAALYENAEPGGRRRSDNPPPSQETLPAAWLGLRYPPGGQSPRHQLTKHSLTSALSESRASNWWEWLFSLGGALASHTAHVSAILKDPVTGLPDRIGFQAVLSEEMEKARLRSRPLSLLFINPDEFAPINERFGREAGDAIIREISSRLRAVLRSSDPVARYGGVILAAALTDTDKDLARRVSEKILHGVSEAAFLDGAVRLGFSIGVAVFDPGDPEISTVAQLIRRADQALNAAKRLGGGCIVDWEERSGLDETGAFDRLSGIFTGNMTKDYRNMVLLWDTIDVIAGNQDFAGLAGEVVEQIYTVFKPRRVALVSLTDEGAFQLVRGLTRQTAEAVHQRRVETIELGTAQEDLLRMAIASGEPRELEVELEDGEKQACYGVPLITSGQVLGGLYLDGNAATMGIEPSDLIFFKALASQLAVALDRARLAEADRLRQEHERRRLRAELKELRQAIQQAKLVYRSPEMEAVVATARRVAPTDATVLITGESGTGKELLARTVHELSSRRERPFVIVDCGSIATTLIESELFGHEKGAYTGAQGRKVGRLAEADRGTVLLDEIGELPLEVQSKLLRFVQEKQFTTVGGNRQRRVDVRILAATNRDLATEVASGRFREDLYYRLNVVRLHVPPLRERPDDTLHLARHFLETFAFQYQKKVRRFAEGSEEKLLRYPWPGNVRELQNRLMQAVILCEDEELPVESLQLPAAVPELEPTRSVPRATVEAPVARDHQTAPAAVVPEVPAGDSWDRLRAALGREIDFTLSGEAGVLYPLGRWLSEDLLLEADAATDGIARRGAKLVGLPETTYRRRLNKAKDNVQAGLAPRSGRWQETREVLRGDRAAGQRRGRRPPARVADLARGDRGAGAQ